MPDCAKLTREEKKCNARNRHNRDVTTANQNRELKTKQILPMEENRIKYKNREGFTAS